jgi:acyl-CoA reductase-like NAD-dependent aldehyde dehydrogenase
VRERWTYVHRLNELVRDEREGDCVPAFSRRTGKSRTDALISEIFPLLEHFEFLLKYAEKALADETVPTPLAMMGKKSRVYYEPLGTILVISPWNYPFLSGADADHRRTRGRQHGGLQALRDYSAGRV